MPEEEYQDITLICAECSNDFLFTARDQAFYKEKGYTNTPKRCKPCRQAREATFDATRSAARGIQRQRVDTEVQCAQCGEQTTVPFVPVKGRPVYCRECFKGRQNQE